MAEGVPGGLLPHASSTKRSISVIGGLLVDQIQIPPSSLHVLQSQGREGTPDGKTGHRQVLQPSWLSVTLQVAPYPALPPGGAEESVG